MLRPEWRKNPESIMKTDVIIIGAGVIGLSIAHELLVRGMEVMLIDPHEPGRGASWAAAGVLAPQGAHPRHLPYLHLLLNSRDMFTGYAARLYEETGIDIEYRTEGGLHVALDDEEAEKIELRYQHQKELSLPVEKLSGDDVRKLEPALSPETRCGLLFEGMHQVENRLLTEALATAVKKRGGHLEIGDPATGLIIKKERVVGVTLPAEQIGADKVIIAAGAWSGILNHIPGMTLPVQPVRGQMLALDIRGLQSMQRVINGLGLYLVPRRNDRLLAGATVEKTGFDTRVTAAGIHHILTQAIRMAPGLAPAPILETWAGLRPRSKDGKPILGPMPMDGLFVAAGHHRNGILLSPVTAALMADCITTGDIPADMQPFLIDRFSKQQA